MRIYKTSNWRDIVEIEAIRVDENHVWLPKLEWHPEYIIERKYKWKTSNVQYWNTIEEAKKYLTDKLNSEISRYEKQILKAKSKIETLR